MMKLLSGISLLLFFFSTELTAQTKFRTGWYRASVTRPDDARLIFNIEVTEKNKKTILYIRNGAERLLVDDIKQKGDSVFIEMPFFESSKEPVQNTLSYRLYFNME